MTFTYDVGADSGRVRLYISDTDPDNAIFSDEAIAVFLEMEGSIRYAAAQALDTIAVNQALILKVTRVLDVSVDGVRVAQALRDQAKLLREQEESSVDGQFDWAEQVFSPSGWADRIWKDAVRRV